MLKISAVAKGSVGAELKDSTCFRFNRAVSIAVFAYMVARNARAQTLSAPAIFRLVDPTEVRLILKHQPNVDIHAIFVEILL